MTETIHSLDEELARLRKLHEEGYKEDIAMYAQQLQAVLDSKNTCDHNAQRMLLAKHFIEVLQAEMQHGLIGAGVFGSTSRNEAHADSDVDILLVLQPLTPQEQKEQNPLWVVQTRRHMSFNQANNGHRIREIAASFSQKTGIKVSPRECYVEDLNAAKDRFKPIMFFEPEYIPAPTENTKILFIQED